MVDTASTERASLEDRKATREPSDSVPASSFMVYNAAEAGLLLSPIARIYDLFHVKLAASPLGRIGLLKDHFPFFVVAVSALFFLFPRYLVLSIHVIQSFLLGQDVPGPDTSELPQTPNDLVIFLLLFLATFFLGKRSRGVVFFFASFPISYFFAHRFDLPSLALLMGLAVLTFAIIRLRLRRIISIPLICSISLGFMFLCNCVEPISSWKIARIARFQPALLPMLWYSVYEELPPKKRLPLGRMLTYLYLRFFVTPVATYRELFYPRKQSISKMRFAGIKALYVAMYATVFITLVGSWAEQIDSQALTGPKLLVFSYILYVDEYCHLVVLFNLVTGVLRLFGIPIRDSFNYWLLARTPNEHWRRWNILLREWVVTFVFFPIMRSKRWLFVAVMAALGTSGLLHIAPQVLPGRFDVFHVLATAFYWTVNGLAIYVVIKVPYLFPDALKRLGIGRSRVWDVVGIVLTSCFYAILRYLSARVGSWNEVLDYLSRLVQV